MVLWDVGARPAGCPCCLLLPPPHPHVELEVQTLPAESAVSLCWARCVCVLGEEGWDSAPRLMEGLAAGKAVVTESLAPRCGRAPINLRLRRPDASCSPPRRSPAFLPELEGEQCVWSWAEGGHCLGTCP